jgi:uncharacterized Tic20 family protein
MRGTSTGTEGEAMQQDPNPGGEQGQVSSSHVGARAMSPQDERTWSMLAHLSVLLLLVGLMPFGALLIWLIYKDRSDKVRFHALQALWYQIAWVVILVVYSLVAVLLSVVTLGIAAIVLVPLAFVIGVVPIIHGCYAAYQVNQGVDYRYPYIADRIEGPRGVV